MGTLVASCGAEGMFEAQMAEVIAERLGQNHALKAVTVFWAQSDSFNQGTWWYLGVPHFWQINSGWLHTKKKKQLNSGLGHHHTWSKLETCPRPKARITTTYWYYSYIMWAPPINCSMGEDNSNNFGFWIRVTIVFMGLQTSLLLGGRHITCVFTCIVRVLLFPVEAFSCLPLTHKNHPNCCVFHL